MLVATQFVGIYTLDLVHSNKGHMGSFCSANHGCGHDAIRLLCHIDQISWHMTRQGTRRGNTGFAFHFTPAISAWLTDRLSGPAANWSAPRSDFRHSLRRLLWWERSRETTYNRSGISHLHKHHSECGDLFPGLTYSGCLERDRSHIFFLSSVTYSMMTLSIQKQLRLRDKAWKQKVNVEFITVKIRRTMWPKRTNVIMAEWN